MTDTPVIVLDTVSQVDEAVAGLVAEGFRVQYGFDLPAEPWDVRSRRRVCVGPVADRDDEEAALLAAVRGAGLVLTFAGDTPNLRFLVDLGHVGPVRHGITRAASDLDPENQQLLRHLANGESVEQAARALGLSSRTAHRRLARARAVLGVSTTAAAVAKFVELSGSSPY